MKKIAFLVLTALFSTISFGQNNSEILKIHKKDKTNKAVILSQIKDIVFEEMQPMVMDVKVGEVTQTEITVDFPMPDNCKKWYMKVVNEPLTGTDAQKRANIIANHNDEFTESKYLKFPGLTPETDYYFYVLLIDKDDVPASMQEVKVRTKAPATDEFEIRIDSVGITTATVTFIPKDKNMRYYFFVVPQSSYDIMIAKEGGIQGSDLEYFQFYASQSQGTLTVEDIINAWTVKGDTTITEKEMENFTVILTPETTYHAYCYGLEPDGTATTAVYEKVFNTLAPKTSDNVINLEITKTYQDGCDVKTTVTNQDQYFMTVQKKETWERAVNTFGNDKNKAVEDIIGTLKFYGALESSLYRGEVEKKLRFGMENTDCVVVYCGYDEGVTTEVKTKEFRTVNE